MISQLSKDLTDVQIQKITELQTKYEGTFSQHEFDIGRTQLVEHAIDTGSHRPVRQALRRHTIAHLEVIDKPVEELVRGHLKMSSFGR